MILGIFLSNYMKELVLYETLEDCLTISMEMSWKKCFKMNQTNQLI